MNPLTPLTAFAANNPDMVMAIVATMGVLGAVVLIARPQQINLQGLLLIPPIPLHWLLAPGSPIRGLFEEGAKSTPAATAYAVAILATHLAAIFYLVRMHDRTYGRIARHEQASKRQLAPVGNEATPNGQPPLERHYQVAAPRYTFADVDGMYDLKEKLGQQLVEILQNPIKGKPKNGILFHGLPGNGKTMMAEALAGECARYLPRGKRVAYLPVSMAELSSRWVNQTTEQLRALFNDAVSAGREAGCCVLFIDEIESALPDRTRMMHSDSEAGKQVTALLTLLVNIRNFATHHVVIVGATNHLDQIDAAAQREGRFDYKTEITPPDEEARAALLVKAARAARLDPKIAARAASRWEGFGVSRILHVGDAAAKRAAREHRHDVTFEDLMAALRDAQGCRGLNLKESTPTLDKLHFNEDLRDGLNRLANRMIHIAEIEEKGGSVPKGVLFYGPPGTGKTAVAQALAKSSGWAFLSTTGQTLMADPNAFEALVTKAANLRPCIVFIDEADDILADRSTNPYGKSATNNLLAIVDGNRPLPDVMFIAATNYEETLDGAAVRGGRFAEQFEFSLPEGDALTAIIRSYMASKSNAPWHPAFTPEAAAVLLADMSPADAKDRLQKAINNAVSRMDGSTIRLADLRAVL